VSEEKLTLVLNWSQAKSLQIAIANMKQDTRGKTWRELDEIEGILEDFTGTATIIWMVKP